MGYFLSPSHTSLDHPPTHQGYVLLSSVLFSKNVLDFWISDCCLQPTTHQVYVLLISNVTVGDAGLYTCEVNFNPVLRSFHQLKVIQNVFLWWKNTHQILLEGVESKAGASSCTKEHSKALHVQLLHVQLLLLIKLVVHQGLDRRVGLLHQVLTSIRYYINIEHNIIFNQHFVWRSSNKCWLYII